MKPGGSISLSVVGADHPNPKGPSRRFDIALCSLGDAVALMLEPDNPADERAVAVYSERGVKIGYLSAERCGLIGKAIRDGREARAIFQEVTVFGCVIRVTFDGAQPVLPPSQHNETVSQRDGQDFWPDPIWPDE